MDDRLPPAAPLSFRHLRLIGVACLVATGLLHSQTADKDQWNKIFNDPKMQFNRQPSRFLIDAAKDRKPRRRSDRLPNERAAARFRGTEGPALRRRAGRGGLESGKEESHHPHSRGEGAVGKLNPYAY